MQAVHGAGQFLVKELDERGSVRGRSLKRRESGNFGGKIRNI